MVLVQLGRSKGIGAALLVLLWLRSATALFDSVWVAEEEAEEAYGPATNHRTIEDEEDSSETVVVDLWQLFFPESAVDFRSPYNLEDVDDIATDVVDSRAKTSPGEDFNDNNGPYTAAASSDQQQWSPSATGVLWPGYESGKREKRQEILHGRSNMEPVIDLPPDYTLLLDLDWPSGEPTEDDTSNIKDSISALLSIPKSHVRLFSNQEEGGTLSAYFVNSYSDPESTDPSDLIPVSEAVRALEAAGIHHWTRDLLGSDEGLQKDVKVQSSTSDYSKILVEPYLAIIIAAAAVILMAIIIIIICCCVRKKKPQPEPQRKPPTAESALLSSPTVPSQICLYPAAKPSVNSGTTIQPPDTAVGQPDINQVLANKSGLLSQGGTPVRTPGTPLSGSNTGSPVYSSSSQSGTPIPGTPEHTPPLRSRTRGLLERRGSNASLTLELCGGSTTTMGSPPKESTIEEYLMAAGNPMSRRRLRRCLDDVKAIYSEFWEIPMNHPDKNFVAGSGMKNRYRTIIPNENRRVLLPETEGDPLSGYINANYIRGYSSETRGYIATQGPMSNTICDFWRMVWQERSPIIVMITKLKEKNKNKCESYIPSFHDTYGDIDVHVESISEKEGYIIRHLRLCHGGEEHEVLHYWYTAWPDHKAPNTARQLLPLVKEVDEKRRYADTKKPKGPTVVHCSAGIGRTGCFIGASVGMLQLRNENMVDVLSIVCNMRLDRGGMVQTNEQYEFVHQTLVLYEQEISREESSRD